MDDLATIRLNIAHYRALLRTKVDTIGRRAISQLLRQAKADQARASFAAAKEKAMTGNPGILSPQQRAKAPTDKD